MAALVPNGKGRYRKLAASMVAVVFSVLGFWWLLEASKVTETYLITKTDLASGTPLLAEQVMETELSLFGLSENYLLAGELPMGSYLVRSLAAGEAIPKSAVSTQLLDDMANVVLSPSVELSELIRPGSRVVVWSAEALDFQSFGEPTITALDSEVVAIREPQGSFSDGRKLVELRVPSTSLQSILRAISNGDAIALTAASGSLAD